MHATSFSLLDCPPTCFAYVNKSYGVTPAHLHSRYLNGNKNKKEEIKMLKNVHKKMTVFFIKW